MRSKRNSRIEKNELASNAEAEREELAGIYVKRGLKPALAREVALQLTEHDALGAHARDELGITPLCETATRAGGAGICSRVYCRGRPATADQCRGCPRIGKGGHCRDVARLAGAARCCCGTCRQCIAGQRCSAGHVVGRAGDDPGGTIGTLAGVAV